MFAFNLTVLSLLTVGFILMSVVDFADEKCLKATVEVILVVLGLVAIIVWLPPANKDTEPAKNTFMWLTDKEHLQILNQRAAEKEATDATHK